jgi:pyruvate-formate lyase-activating enzyme
MTNIYHIVYFESDRSIYVFFRGCNFACKGCILKLSPWDCHLPVSLHSKLQKHSASPTLPLAELDSLIEKLKVERAVLGGAEPTVDEELIGVVRLLRSHGVYVILLTNGHNLNADMVQSLEDVGLNEVCVSIKALTDSIHTYYTGVSNRRVLENFKRLSGCRMKLRAESVLIPSLIDIVEIERIAKFIASLNPAIPYRIDAYFQVPSTPWPDAPPERVKKAVEISRKYLENVSYLHGDVPVTGGVRVIYPKI